MIERKTRLQLKRENLSNENFEEVWVCLDELKKELVEFDKYVHETRDDWSNFDGRHLLQNWNRLVLHKIIDCNETCCRQFHLCNSQEQKKSEKILGESHKEILETSTDLPSVSCEHKVTGEGKSNSLEIGKGSSPVQNPIDSYPVDGLGARIIPKKCTCKEPIKFTQDNLKKHLGSKYVCGCCGGEL